MTPLKKFAWYNVIFLPITFIVFLFIWIFSEIDFFWIILAVFIVWFVGLYIRRTNSSSYAIEKYASDEMEEMICQKAHKVVSYPSGNFLSVGILLIIYFVFDFKGIQIIEVRLLFDISIILSLAFAPLYSLTESIAVLVIYRRLIKQNEKGNQSPLGELPPSQSGEAK